MTPMIILHLVLYISTRKPVLKLLECSLVTSQDFEDWWGWANELN